MLTTLRGKLLLGLLGGQASAPINTVAPSFTGTDEVSALQTGDEGTWVPEATGYTYQWYRDDVAIAGATDSTYTTVTADAGTTLTFGVTPTDAGAVEAISAGTAIYWSAPTLTSPANAAELLDLTPDRAWDAVSGYTGDYEIEQREVLIGTPTELAVSANPSTSDTLDNIVRYYWRVRAENGKWSSSRYFDTHYSYLRDQYSTDQADVDARTCDITGDLDGVTTVTGIDVAGGAVTLTTAAVYAMLYDNVTVPRSAQPVVINEFTTRSGVMGFNGSKINAVYSNLLHGSLCGSLGLMGDGGSAQALGNATPTLSSGDVDKVAVVAFPSGGSAVFYRLVADGLWYLAGRGRRGTTADIYPCVGGVNNQTQVITESDVLPLSTIRGVMATEYDWQLLHTTTPLADTLYDLEGEGIIWLKVTAPNPDSGALRLKYRYFDADNYHFIELTGGNVVAKKCVAGTDTDYTAALSAAAYSAGDVVWIGVSVNGTSKFVYCYNQTTNTYIWRNTSNTDSFNSSNTGVSIANADWTLDQLDLHAWQAAAYAALNLSASAVVAQVIAESADIGAEVTYA